MISYKHNTFKRLMELDGITNTQMEESLSLMKNRNMIFEAGEGTG